MLALVAGYNIDDLRRALGKNNRQFYDHFRAAFGIAPWHLVQHCRMEVAVRLLRDPSLPIIEVAHCVGYSG